MKDGMVLKATLKLVKALDKEAVSHLPEELQEIVRLHSGIAVATTLVPIPGADIAAAAANVWTMYAQINRKLDMPFSENVIKSVATGIVTNLGAAVAGTMVISTTLKCFPGLGTVAGAAVMATTVYSVTLVSGVIYMKILAGILERKKAGEISDSEIKNAAEKMSKNRDLVDSMIREGKKEYKNRKK